jgi:CysZ protein
MLTALFRGLGDLLLPGVRQVLLWSVALTLLFLGVIGFAMWLGFDKLFLALGATGLSMSAGAVAAVALTLLLGWLAFRTLAMAIISLFSDQIVAAVEWAHYPASAATLRPVPVRHGVVLALRSAGRAAGWNLLALPLYVLLLLTGVGAPLLFLLLNAYLLGRDLADTVEPRHPALRPFSGLERWWTGLAAAALFLVPVLNLLAPAWSVAMATHRFHRRKG